MTIRTREDEEYSRLEPKMWQHISGALIIGVPSYTKEREIADIYKLKPEAPVPQTMKDFRELHLNDQVTQLEKPSTKDRSRSLNHPNWELRQ